MSCYDLNQHIYPHKSVKTLDLSHLIHMKIYKCVIHVVRYHMEVYAHPLLINFSPPVVINVSGLSHHG